MNELAIRLAAFDWLKSNESLYQGVFPFGFLQRGFDYQGERISLASMQGIFKPKSFQYPISIRTAVGGPYPDGTDENNLISYSYRGTNPQHPENVGLREMMKERIPLIYFKGVIEGGYIAIWPVFIVGDDSSKLTFTATADDPLTLKGTLPAASESLAARRAYVMTTVQKRVHQAAFRAQVLDAYKTACTLCQIKHRELLDAAHIIPDLEEKGDPIVPNGLAMCKIHHAAYDSQIIGISPDFVVHVRRDILEEVDGPMLTHGIQSLDRSTLVLPHSKHHWPDRERLESRFKNFFG